LVVYFSFAVKMVFAGKLRRRYTAACKQNFDPCEIQAAGKFVN